MKYTSLFILLVLTSCKSSNQAYETPFGFMLGSWQRYASETQGRMDMDTTMNCVATPNGGIQCAIENIHNTNPDYNSNQSLLIQANNDDWIVKHDINSFQPHQTYLVEEITTNQIQGVKGPEINNSFNRFSFSSIDPEVLVLLYHGGGSIEYVFIRTH